MSECLKCWFFPGQAIRGSDTILLTFSLMPSADRSARRNFETESWWSESWSICSLTFSWLSNRSFCLWSSLCAACIRRQSNRHVQWQHFLCQKISCLKISISGVNCLRLGLHPSALFFRAHFRGYVWFNGCLEDSSAVALIRCID